MPTLRRPLLVPTLLAVAALAGPGSCAEQESNDEGADASASADSGGAAQCDDLTAQAACEAEDACAWDNGDCIFDCTAYTDEATCNSQEFCFWTGNSCEFGAI